MTTHKRIKLLYLISALKKCGPVSVLLNIIKGLDTTSFDVTVLSLSESDESQLTYEFETLSVEYICLKQSRLKGFVNNNEKVKYIVKDKSIDLIHSHGFRADWINAKQRMAISICTIHNFPSEDYKSRYGVVLGTWMSWKHKKLIQDIDYPVSCSKTVRNKFKDHYKIKTICIQNGIDFKAYSPLTNDKKILRESLNLPCDKEIFIVSGALSPLKNPNTIIEAFESAKMQNQFLLFIGQGPLFNSLSKTYESSHIHFAGFVENVQDYLRASDFYISASLTEGLPNSVMEAIGVGIPVILSDIPPHTELIGSNYTLLFDPENSSDLKRLLTTTGFKEKRKEFQDRMISIKEDFSALKMSRNYAELYLSSLKNLKAKSE